jgi:PilZ domain
MGTENRKFARRDIDRTIQIDMADGSTAGGVLVDLSQGGARLKVSDPDRLPEQFMLKLSESLQRWARIAWRSIDEIGVEFVSAPQPPIDKKEKVSVHILCPKTGKTISTGFQLTTASDLSNLSDIRRFTQCAHCRVVHGWNPRDASLTIIPV